MFSYSGELEIENEDFYLYADRLIVRDGAIAFMFSGSDEHGDFRIDGVAIQTIQENCVTSQIKLAYQKYISSDLASIQFDVISQTNKNLRCKVKGKWLQYGDTWSFSGNLRKFKA